MRDDNRYRDRVRERDLDNFLVEELSASDAFRDWVLCHVPAFRPTSAAAVRVRKSPPRETNDARQTDLQVGWFSGGTLRSCLLIESKVTEGFQPGQAEDYAREVRALRDRLGERAAAALLVAPAGRLSLLPHAGAFDAELSIEAIIGFLEARLKDLDEGELSRRIGVRIELLEALCGKPSSVWIARTIAEKRDFAEAYSALAAEILPDLRVRPSSDGPSAITRLFEGLAIPGLPDLTLRHEFGRGVAEKYGNVQFPGRAGRLGDLRASGLLTGTPYVAAKAGGSLAIRVRTPGVDPMRSFEEERDKVETGLRALAEMVRWLRGNAARLARVLDPG